MLYLVRWPYIMGCLCKNATAMFGGFVFKLVRSEDTSSGIQFGKPTKGRQIYAWQFISSYIMK